MTAYFLYIGLSRAHNNPRHHHKHKQSHNATKVLRCIFLLISLLLVAWHIVVTFSY